MSDQDEGEEFDYAIDAEIPSYGDNKAQRAKAFEYLAARVDTLRDPKTKELGYAMLKALVEAVQDKPLRGLKTVEASDG